MPRASLTADRRRNTFGLAVAGEVLSGFGRRVHWGFVVARVKCGYSG